MPSSASNQITVRALKHNGKENRQWNARLRRTAGNLLILDAEFDVDVQHELLGTITKGTRTIEYYWLDRWYNIFQFLKDNGETMLFYCNINMPPARKDDVLTYVDLDIDVLVDANLSYRVLDEDEFEANAMTYGYSDEIRRHAHEAVTELSNMIEGRQFPFNDKLSQTK
jgi:uncharacterized protein